MLGKKRKPGRKIEEISIGEKISVNEKIEDKDLLLFLGLTNDANPLYIQHDYASQTAFKKPIVPSIMLTGIVTSSVSKYLPGPGSHIVKQNLSFTRHVYHYSMVEIILEVSAINLQTNTIEIKVEGTDESGENVLEGLIHVCPPTKIEKIEGNVLENF